MGNITPISIFAIKRFFNAPYTKPLLGSWKLDIHKRMHIAQRGGCSQKLSQQQEREVRQKSSIANIAITAAEGPFSTVLLVNDI